MTNIKADLLFKFVYFILEYSFLNAVYISGVQQSDWVIHTCLFFLRFFSHVGFYEYWADSLCCTIGLCWLPILIQQCVCVCMLISNSQFIPPPPPFLTDKHNLFFDWVVWIFDIELHELVVNFGNLPLFGQSACKYFLPFCGLSFCFVYGVLSCAKAFEFNFPFIHFYFHYSSRWAEKVIAVIYVRVFCLCFPLSFIVSDLTFRSLVYSEFTFVYSVKEYSNFISYM